ncbi:hypothetical protein [Solirhodobacter olei]|uniref:hypothetical protein n=1 Tax=Solirhodobacter olei TaxID=2493082 RepID=UPI000FDACFDB|nr:hypothetical protein [Solirhodobacter olei]
MLHQHSFPTPDPLRQFFQDHLAGLESATTLLGGAGARRNLQLLVEELSRNPGLSRVAKTRLVSLVDLLSLQHVGDVDRPEAGFFAAIDLNWPVVAEIQLLTDQLQHAVRAFGGWAAAHGMTPVVLDMP